MQPRWRILVQLVMKRKLISIMAIVFSHIFPNRERDPLPFGENLALLHQRKLVLHEIDWLWLNQGYQLWLFASVVAGREV